VTFQPAAHNWLLAGKDPVATDSIATLLMGLNPETPQLERPNGTFCDNHLYLARQKGLGTNLLSEIELVGDGAGGIFGVEEDYSSSPEGTILYQNYPNPFNNSTIIKFHVAQSGHVRLCITDASGKEIKVLIDKTVSYGDHQYEWNEANLPGGIYYCILQCHGNSQMKRMVCRNY